MERGEERVRGGGDEKWEVNKNNCVGGGAVILVGNLSERILYMDWDFKEDECLSSQMRIIYHNF